MGVRETLSGSTVHDQWTTTFHGSLSQPFFDAQFDRIAACFRSAPPGPVLDAGCGPGHQVERLLDRGLEVVGFDFSPAALAQAAQRIGDRGVDWVQGDITDAPFETGQFSRILCYGVLMHIPDLAAAVAELARLLAPGGVLIVSEGNMHSLDDWSLAVARMVLGKHRKVRRTVRGTETYTQTEAGPLFIRHANISWLTEAFEQHGLELREREAGQFSEMYSLLPDRLAPLLHRINRLPLPARLSFGTLLVFERP
jgi:SAM-dependent methyltransferase